MKVWIKYLFAAIFGIICALILPVNNPAVAAAINFLTEIVIRFGRYMVIPVIFFTGIIAFNRLRENHLLIKTAVWTGSVIAVSSLILTAVGLISILVVKLPRIPITVENVTEATSLNVEKLFRA